MLVSVTRLHLRHWWDLPMFVRWALRSAGQAQDAHGFVGGALMLEPMRGFWTVTGWSDEASMRAFRNAAPHLQAMPRLLDWCDEASYAHWEQPDEALPSADMM